LDVSIIVSILIFVLLMLVGFPIAYSFAAATAYIVIACGNNPVSLLVKGFWGLNSEILLALPFFIALGYLVAGGSASNRLINFVDSILGRLRGGLGVASVFASAIFGAISGAAAASVTAIGTIMIPQMEARGYPRGYSAALISSVAVLSTMIPPSIAMILFAFVSSQSVAACFLATIGPAVILMVLFSGINIFMVRKMPVAVSSTNRGLREELRMFQNSTKRALPTLLLPVIILGGIYGGIATPTEAAAISVLYLILLSTVVHRDQKLGDVLLSLRSSCSITGANMILVFFAVMLSHLYTMEMVPQQIATLLLGLTSNKILLLALVNVFLIIVGMLMLEQVGVIIATPLLLPLMLEMGIHPIHFAAIIGTNLGMGMMTPPVAGILYLGARIGNVSIDKMIKPTLIFILFASIPTVIVTTYWPNLSLFLPRLAGFID